MHVELYFSSKVFFCRESSSMCSLLVLNLNTSDNGIFHNGESVCIALCNVARQHADDVYISLYIFVYIFRMLPIVCFKLWRKKSWFLVDESQGRMLPDPSSNVKLKNTYALYFFSRCRLNWKKPVSGLFLSLFRRYILWVTFLWGINFCGFCGLTNSQI